MKHYLSKRNDDNDDEDDRYVRNVENQIRKDSTELLKLWMTMMSSRKGLK
jgi:hypothetical protein